MANPTTLASQFWGNLVVYGPTEDPRPSDNLSRLLRGIANYLIENDPRAENGGAIPPSRMIEFYREQRFTGELNKWKSKYFERRSNLSLSWLYRELECEHFNMSRECIPALTPSGFETWMFTRLMAYPNYESERIQNILSSWPIIDTNSGLRFPNLIPRGCFPGDPDQIIQDRMTMAQDDSLGELVWDNST